MDARKEVRRRVGRPEPLAERRKGIVAGKILRAQVVSVGIERRNDEKYRHSREQKRAQLIKVRPVVPCGIDNAPGHVGEPEQVWDDKIFTERNIVIQRHMDHMKVGCDRLLQIVEPDQIDEEMLNQHVCMHELAPVDLVIRTGGEHRISNFLLWQIAYAELYFTDVLWPDFDEQDFEGALNAFANRERRFGGTEPGDETA